MLYNTSHFSLQILSLVNLNAEMFTTYFNLGSMDSIHGETPLWKKNKNLHCTTSIKKTLKFCFTDVFIKNQWRQSDNNYDRVWVIKCLSYSVNRNQWMFFMSALRSTVNEFLLHTKTNPGWKLKLMMNLLCNQRVKRFVCEIYLILQIKKMK